MKKLIHDSIQLLHASILLATDSGVIITSLWLGYHLWILSPMRMLDSIPPFDWSHVLFYALIIDAALIWGRTYGIKSSISHVLWLKEIIKYCLVGFLVAIFVGFFTRYLLVARLQVFLTFVILLPGIVIERLFIDKLWSNLIARRFFSKRVIIYGAGNTGKRLARALERHPKLGYQPIGFFDDLKVSNSVVMANPLPVLGGRKELRNFLSHNKDKVDEVIIAMPAVSNGKNIEVISICNEYGLPYKFVPNLNDLMLHRVHQEQLDGIPLFSRKDIGIPLTNRIIKRVFDIIFSFLILLITAPIIALISYIIRKDTDGPAIFNQKRVGYKGKIFTMYKFRTMFEDTSPYDLHPDKKTDPRITRFGRFLRKTSLDEMPQFWNVLKGDMSIVGPRPEMSFIVDTYNTYQRERLNAKPGITGLWQISGDRSLPIHENIDHDLYYISNQSILLDLVIIFQTVWFALIRGVGAK